MKMHVWTILPMALILAAGCKEEPRVLPEEPAPKPVVNMAPVPTRPFEDGYEAGFELGRQQGVPHGKLPDPAAVRRLASEQAAGHSERTERWERGFADGYMDGYSNVVTGKK